MASNVITKSRVEKNLFLRMRQCRWVTRILWLLGPILGFCFVEIMNTNNPFTSFTISQVVLNLLWYYLLAGVCYLAIGRLRGSCATALVLFYLIGTANRYAASFRGRTIFPGDLLSLGTAFNVAGNYNYTPNEDQIITGILLVVFLVLLALSKGQKGRYYPKLPWLAGAVVAGGLFLTLFFATGMLDALKITPSMWTTRENGLMLNFTVCLRASRVEVPEGYSLEQVTALTAAYPGTAGGETPKNIIVVMNESFADLTQVGDFTTNQETMPFYRSLTENTIRGTAYSSVFGGTTANSEYEFLTGNTTAFLPAGTVPYHLYVDETTTSLVGQAKAAGYQTLAMHPYHASGWNRPSVYANLGFDDALFLPAFQNTTLMRGYVSDQSNYENVIQAYEARRDQGPLFLFNITMQNHSGYSVPWTGLERSTWMTGTHAGKYPTVNQFLALMQESDRALEYLITYFSQVAEPTVVVVFGDHQPQVAERFYTDMLGAPAERLSVSRRQYRHQVPYLVWANYPLEGAGEGPDVSLNYLGALVASWSGLPTTGYQDFLLDAAKALPVANTVGFTDATGLRTDEPLDLTPAAQQMLADYKILQYNNLFGGDDWQKEFFSPG